MAAAICSRCPGALALDSHAYEVDMLGVEPPGKRFRVDAGGRARRDREVQLQDFATRAGVRLPRDRRAGGTDIERPLLSGLRETNEIVRPPRRRAAPEHVDAEDRYEH